jgi:uncharacterized protein (TIGR02594 family)
VLVHSNLTPIGRGVARLTRSWLDWGTQLSEPCFGCITILEREHPDGWQGHVGFFLKIEGDRIFLLGGNQLNEGKRVVRGRVQGSYMDPPIKSTYLFVSKHI